MILRRVLTVSALLASALALSACGGSDSTTDSGDASLTAFCSSYLVVQDKTTALGTATDGTLEEQKTALSEFAKSLRDLADDSPEEIQADVQATADWASDAEDAVADADSLAAFQKAGTSFGKDNPQPSEASQKADQFENDNCTDDGKPVSGDDS